MNISSTKNTYLTDRLELQRSQVDLKVGSRDFEVDKSLTNLELELGRLLAENLRSSRHIGNVYVWIDV